MAYSLTITRGSETILTKEISADEAVDFLREGGGISDSKVRAQSHSVKADKPVPKYTEERRGKGIRHCKSCGKVGHRSDDCPDTAGTSDEAEAIVDAEEPVSREKKVKIGPMKVIEIKRLLQDENNSIAYISSEVGVPAETIEKFASDLGLR